MNQLQYNTGAFRHARAHVAHSPHQRIFGIVFAATVELGIVYALMVSLGAVPAPPGIVVTTARIIPDEPQVQPPPVPLAPVIETPVAQPITPDIELVYIPPPSMRTITLPTVPPLLPTLPRQATVVPPAPVIYTPPRAILATHTTPEYPPVARRLAQQGTLRLKLVVTEQGTVSDAVVVNSSGSDYLDKAAVDWVKKFWRYEPAKQGTRAVTAEVPAVVEFKLQ